MMKLRPFFCTFLPALAAVFAFNARYGSKAPLDVAEQIAATQQADEVVVSDTTLYQRGWIRRRLAHPPPACPDVVVFGSSTVGTLAQDMFEGRTLLNAWLGNASVEDMESFNAIASAAACAPKAIVIGADVWWTGNGGWKFEGWQVLASDYAAYQSSRGSFAAHLPLRARWDEYKENLSFQRTLDTARAGRARGFATDEQRRAGLRLLKVDTVCADAKPDELVLRTFDGHYMRCPGSEPNADAVHKVAREYVATNQHNIADWHELSSERLERLGAVLSRWHVKGSSIVIVGMPYHPLAWEKLSGEPTIAQNVRDLDTRLGQIAKDVDGAFLPLRDPSSVSCVATDFEDSHHARPTCTRRVAQKILEAVDQSRRHASQ